MRFLFFVLILLPTNILAQVLKGKVIDTHTGKPISSVHIYNPEINHFGTISNDLGEFIFDLREKDSLVLYFSHISYNSDSAHVSKNSNAELEVQLVPATVTLKEIVVSNRGYNIARKAAEWLNHSKLEYWKGFYRQISMMDTIPTEFIEAFYEISSQAQGIDQIKIDQARFGRMHSDKSLPLFQMTNFSYLTTGFKVNQRGKNSSIMKPLTENGLEVYSFSIEKEYQKDDQKFVMINCVPPKHTLPSEKEVLWQEAQLVYNLTKDKLESYQSSINHALGTDNLRFDDSVAVNKVSINSPRFDFFIRYATSGYAINYIHVNYTFDYQIEETVYPSQISSKLFFYQQSEKKFRKLRTPQLALEDVKIFEEAKYRPRFWKNNPVIKRTEEEEKIISAFEKENAFGTYFKGK